MEARAIVLTYAGYRKLSFLPWLIIAFAAILFSVSIFSTGHLPYNDAPANYNGTQFLRELVHIRNYIQLFCILFSIPLWVALTGLTLVPSLRHYFNWLNVSIYVSGLMMIELLLLLQQHTKFHWFFDV